MTHEVPSIRTLRLKVKREVYGWLNAAAIEVNVVWNFANETSYRAARPFAGAAGRTDPRGFSDNRGCAMDFTLLEKSG